MREVVAVGSGRVSDLTTMGLLEDSTAKEMQMGSRRRRQHTTEEHREKPLAGTTSTYAICHLWRSPCALLEKGSGQLVLRLGKPAGNEGWAAGGLRENNPGSTSVQVCNLTSNATTYSLQVANDVPRSLPHRVNLSSCRNFTQVNFRIYS